MSSAEDKDSDEEFIARGQLERDKVSKKLFKKKRLELEAYFQGFRGFMKTDNQTRSDSSHSFDVRKEMFNILSHELDKTLTQSQKNHLVRLWKPTVQPIILVGDLDELEDVRSYLNSKKMARVSLSEEKQIVDLRIRQPGSNHFDFISPTVFKDHSSNNLSTQQSMNTSGSSKDPSPLFTAYTNSQGIECMESMNREGHLESQNLSIEEVYIKLSRDIENNADIDAELRVLRSKFGIQLYKRLVDFTGEHKEPIVFQLALKLETYISVLDLLCKDGLIDLNQKNNMNISLFSFLLIKDLYSLYKFMEYMKRNDMIDCAKKICAKDAYFLKAFSQKKKEMMNVPLQVRQVFGAVEKMCFTEREA